MERNPDALHRCPLYNREIRWGECIEVQEVREDSMDMEWLREPFDMDRAGEICGKCGWCIIP